MARKRKAVAGGKKAGGKKVGGKKAKLEEKVEEEENVEEVQTAEDIIETPTDKRIFHVDSNVRNGDEFDVYGDYDCTLNQTNIGKNNNKFYVIQLLIHEETEEWYTWNRWGRVGETGDFTLKGPFAEDEGIKLFEKKFQEKTKNKWANRDKFTPVPGKYTLLEMHYEEDDVEYLADGTMVDSTGKKVADSKLALPTQKLLEFIFDKNMFKSAMQKFDIDVKKMPLGKLSKVQIDKGFEVLEEVEEELKKDKPASAKLKELSSKFYTVIPHSFGYKIPPSINDAELLQQKLDMLTVLGDIELAQSLQKNNDKAMTETEDTVPNPLDVKYGLLSCKLEHIDADSEEFKVLSKYKDSTEGHNKKKLENIWKVTRDGEDERFKVHDKITNRKLLWHGTNVAVVAAILKSGLRIMPHSGGRVGRGIYFASESGKSAGYVRPSRNTGIMFLNEVVLGKEFQLQQDRCTLRAAPKGYNSVVAMGRTEPDSKHDTHLMIDGKKVIVPQGKPVNQPDCSNSRFAKSEYLIYKESQNRIRYLLQMEFPY